MPTGFDFCPVCGQDQRTRMRRPPTEQMQIRPAVTGHTGPNAPTPITGAAGPPTPPGPVPPPFVPAPPPSPTAAGMTVPAPSNYRPPTPVPAPPPGPNGPAAPRPRTNTPMAGMTVPAPGLGQSPAPGRTIPAIAINEPPRGPPPSSVGKKDLPFSPFDPASGPMREEMPAVESKVDVDDDLTERHSQADLAKAIADLDADRTTPHVSIARRDRPLPGDDDKTVPHPSMGGPRRTLPAMSGAMTGGADQTRPDRPGVFSGGPSGRTASPDINVPRAGPGTGEPRPPSGHVPAPGQSGTPRLVIVSRDGTEGESFPFLGTTMTVGRTHGDLLFPEDPFLSPVHVRLQRSEDGKLLLIDAGTTNGVYLRIHGTAAVYPGDHFMVGHQLLRLENLDGQVQETPSGLDGTRMFGTPLQPAWGRLSQVGRGGMAGDKFYLRGARVVIGREDGDLTFPNDPYVSREHASLRLEIRGASMAVYLEDLHSANGTYVRIRGSAELGPMDTFRVGDQILRLRLD